MSEHVPAPSSPLVSSDVLNNISKKQTLTAIMASTVGWSLDLFDLFLLLYVAPSVSKLFFPSDYPTLSLAGVYTAFAISCLVRPLGSVLFGSYADKHGRKKALFVTMGGVGIITASLGALPTVQTVGMLAPVLFLFLRVLQGLFVGGVTASTHTIGTETVPPSWRGWVSGLVTGGGGGLGALLASFVFLIISSIFPGESFNQWGWRCMFFSGLLSAVFAIIIFATLSETPFFVAMQKNKKSDAKPPIKAIFSKEYRTNTLLNLPIVFGAAGVYYLTAGYLPSFLEMVMHVPQQDTAKLLVLSSIAGVVSPLLVGQFSEKFGRRTAFIISSVICIPLFLFFGFSTLKTMTDFSSMLMVAAALSFVGNGIYAPVLIFLNERYPTRYRATGTGVCWNIGFSLGGLMPLLATTLSPTMDDIPQRLTILLVALCVLLILAALKSPETRGNFE